MSQNIEMLRMIKALKEAGSYEENMSKDDIQGCYEAINASKDSAALYESRQNDSIFNLDSSDTGSNSSDTENSKPIDDYHKIPPFGFNDLPKPTEPELEIVYRKPKYVNIQNSEEFLNASKSERIAMLYSYHTMMGKKFAALSSQSFYPVPLPEPFLVCQAKCDDVNENYEFPVEEEPEMYVSRSGRHVKRKVYTETVCVDESTMKKQKTNPDKSVSKKIEAAPNDTEVPVKKTDKIKRQTSIKNLTNEEIMERSSLFDNGTPNKGKKKSVPRSTKNEEPKKIQKQIDTQQKRTQKHCRNQESNIEKEIFVYENIFTDTLPPKKTKTKVPTESEMIFDQMKANIHKKQIREQVVASLKNLDQIDVVEEPDSDTTQDEKVHSYSGISYEKDSKNKSSNKEDIQCPMCHKYFPQSLISEHASSCGELLPNTNTAGICQNCDSFSLDLEEHKKSCQ